VSPGENLRQQNVAVSALQEIRHGRCRCANTCCDRFVCRVHTRMYPTHKANVWGI